MTDRACPACLEAVLPHQTLCPSCRTPVPSEAGPVGAGTGTITFSAPPPRPTATPVDTAPLASDAAHTFTAPPPEPPAPGPRWAEPLPPVGPAPVATAYGVPIGAPPEGHVSAGTLGAPGAQVLDERGNLPGGIAGLVAAALVTVGVFLPWMAVEGREVSGWAASTDAKVLLGLAGVATVVAALLIGGARSLVLRLTLVVLGVATVGLGAFEVASAQGIDEFDVTIGGGLFLVIAGGLVAAAGGVLTRHRRFLPGPA